MSVGLIALLIGVALVAGVGYYGSLLITDIPYLAVPYTPKDFGWASEDISFLTSDGVRLRGWFVPAAVPSGDTIMVHHGVGSNAGDMLLNTLCLHGGPWNLFYYNFRGHGDSEGKRTSLGPLELVDMMAALEFLKTQKTSSAQRLAVYGHSLGAAVALVGAARFPEILGVVAESSFASISRTVKHFAKLFHGIPLPFVHLAILFTGVRLGMPIGRFNPVEAVGKISPRPVLLIQGERDRRVPQADADMLWQAALPPKEQWIVPGADHGDPWMVAKDEYERRLTDFFRKVFP